jgi:hypothetical protein
VNHEWEKTGVTIDTNPPFSEEFCIHCGAIAWGGNREGECKPETLSGQMRAFTELLRPVFEAPLYWLDRQLRRSPRLYRWLS